jgi:peptide/nickel transport system substrate-binding protein
MVRARSTRLTRALGAGLGIVALAAWAISAHAAGKTFVYALYDEPDTLDSAKMATDVALHPTWLICDSLVNLSKDGQRLEPGLAESWTLSPDGLQATLKIRSGVQFHDGTPVDAEAVRTSVERHFQPVLAGEPRNSREHLLRELVDSVSVPNASTIVLKLRYPGLHYLSQVDVVSPTATARLGNRFGRQPVCSGPFKFESWHPGDRLTVVANDRYWSGRPRLDRVVFRFINEPAAVVEAMGRGEIDFTPHVVDPIHFEKVRNSLAVALIQVPALNVTYLGFNVGKAPLSDLRVRRAIVQALDIQRMTVFLGRGAAVPARGPLSPAVKGYDPAVAQAARDPFAAQATLQKAGVGSGLMLRLIHHEGYTIHHEVAGAIQNDLGRIGVGVELVGKASFGEVLAAARAQEGDMFVSAWNVRGPYPERILFPLFHSRSLGTTNLMRYRNPRLDALLEEAPRLADATAQQRAYSQAQRLIVDDTPAAFLYHAARVAAANKRVRRLEVNLGALPHDKLVTVDLQP